MTTGGGSDRDRRFRRVDRGGPERRRATRDGVRDDAGGFALRRFQAVSRRARPDSPQRPLARRHAVLRGARQRSRGRPAVPGLPASPLSRRARPGFSARGASEPNSAAAALAARLRRGQVASEPPLCPRDSGERAAALPAAAASNRGHGSGRAGGADAGPQSRRRTAGDGRLETGGWRQPPPARLETGHGDADRSCLP